MKSITFRLTERLLAEIDRVAAERGVSRNRLILAGCAMVVADPDITRAALKEFRARAILALKDPKLLDLVAKRKGEP